MAAESDDTSAGDSVTSSAAMFSSRRDARLVPGIGTMSGPWANSQAIATCPAVQPFVRATPSMAPRRPRLRARLSAAKRG
jgi:hypothetical protein